MTKYAEKSRWMRFLRTTAHLAIATLWFIVLTAYVPDLLQLSLFRASEPVELAQDTSLQPDAVAVPAIIVAALGGLLIIGLLVYVIKRFYIPSTDKAVERMTESAQKQILTTIEKRQPKLPKKEKQRISRYAIEATYFLLIAAPLLVIFIGQPIQTETIRLLTEFALSILALYALIALIAFNAIGHRAISKVG